MVSNPCYECLKVAFMTQWHLTLQSSLRLCPPILDSSQLAFALQTTPLLAGLAVGAAAYAGRAALQAAQAWKAAGPRMRQFYKGGFLPEMTRREASLILGKHDGEALARGACGDSTWNLHRFKASRCSFEVLARPASYCFALNQNLGGRQAEGTGSSKGGRISATLLLHKSLVKHHRAAGQVQASPLLPRCTPKCLF